jgi:hypothetical protein
VPVVGLTSLQDSEPRLLHEVVNSIAYDGQRADEFEFLPLRHGVIVECSIQSGFLFIDVKLMAFLDYAGNTGASRLDSWKRTIGGHDSRPHPVSTPGGEGYFIYEEKELDGFFSERDREVSWKGVIDALNSTPLNDCVTYQVLGFYEITGWRQRIARRARALLAKSISLPIFRPRAWSGRRTQLLLQFLLSQSERRIEPMIRGSDCWYELPMGESILLRIIVYRPTSLPSGDSKTLVLAYDRQAFSSVSESELPIESRYDDIRTLVSCARLVDPTFTSFSIRQKPENGTNAIWAAEPSFLLRIGPPRFFLMVTLAVFAFGLYCLNLSSSESLPLSETWSACHAWMASISRHPRPLGTLCVLYASWNYLRKFPLK